MKLNLISWNCFKMPRAEARGYLLIIYGRLGLILGFMFFAF